MKNKLIALIAIPTMLAISTASFANSEHQDRDSKRSPEKMLSHLTQALALTDAQQTQVAALIEQQQANRASNNLTRREQRQAMKDAMTKILSADQISTLDSLKKQRRGKHQN